MLPNLKICGITDPETARLCADIGADALGAVFFPKSPRHVTPRQACALFDGLPPRIARVGVFVDLPPSDILAIAREARLTAIQLHGDEPPSDIPVLQAAGYRVIKVLKTAGQHLPDAARAIPASAGILIECGSGTLPGGNGAAWDWAAAAPLAGIRPFALAGGLTPGNIADALRLSRASACDISSGVETSPGIKDPAAIRTLAAALARWPPPPAGTGFWHSSPR